MRIMEFTEEEETQLKEVFDDLDADGSGQLDSNELIEGARLWGLNPTRQEVEEAWMHVDMDNSGSLSFDEFKMLMLQMRKSDEVGDEYVKTTVEEQVSFTRTRLRVLSNKQNECHL